MTSQPPGLNDRQVSHDELVSALASSRAHNAALNAEVMQLMAALNLAREQLAAMEQRCREDLDRQRTRLLTEVLAIFS